MHLTQHEALEWTEIDAAITRLAADKGALDLDIGRWLLVAQREGVERRLGFGSFAEYVERRLGYDARTTFERLRVARALEVLPALASLLRRGQRSWSASCRPMSGRSGRRRPSTCGARWGRRRRTARCCGR